MTLSTEQKNATGYAAIEIAENDSSVTLGKYADPVSGQTTGISIDDAREVAQEDPSLIYIVK